MSKPYTNAVTKSDAFWMLFGSSVSFPVCEMKTGGGEGDSGRVDVVVREVIFVAVAVKDHYSW